MQLDSGSITDQDRDKIQIHSYCSNVTDIDCSSIHTQGLQGQRLACSVEPDQQSQQPHNSVILYRDP